MKDDLSAYRRSTGVLGTVVHYYPRTTSTNDLLLQMGEAGAPEGTLVIADEQTAGRGRMGRRWSAPPGTALLFSLLFRPSGAFAQQAPRIPMLCGLALIEAIRICTGLPAQLKWPNDGVLQADGTWYKLAGTLSDVGFAAGAPAFLVVGIGLNVNVPREVCASLAPNAGSLAAALGAPVNRLTLLDTFLQRADAYYAELQAGWDPWPSWASCLAWIGQRVTLQTPTGTLEGVFEGVEASGALILRTADGWRQSYAVGDVSLRPVKVDQA